MLKKFTKILSVYLFSLIFSCLFFSCNMILVAVRNVPVFFESPQLVENKITNPVDSNVRLSALWIGHATVLLQIDDKIIITDPFLSETAGEFARRVVEPGIEPEYIPKCDLILISHSHFDHLNYYSLSLLEQKNSKTSLVFPQGLENYLPNYKMNLIRMKNDNGYKNKVIGETNIINSVKVTSVFAQHWGGRYGLDGYLWADNSYTGYIIEYNGITVYFAGDTGYHETNFKTLGKLFQIDLALIPIGPCSECEQCGTFNHVFPPCAVQIFTDLNAKWLIPIHYGTLMFAQADPMEPLTAFNNIINEKNIQHKVSILKIGEQKKFILK
jgi:L-ascorbate metabolism protein UlaG (beta-lactamase superfamily)